MKFPAMRGQAGAGRWWASPGLHVLLLALSLSAYKLLALEVGSRELLQCQWCLSNKALAYEGEYLFLMASLYLLAGLMPFRALRLAFRLTLVGLLVITLVDLVVLVNFYRRFSLVEMVVFGSQVSAVASFLRQLVSNVPSLLATLGAMALLLLVLGRYLLHDRLARRSPLAICVVAVGLTACKLAEPAEFHTGYLKNSAEAFFTPWTSGKPYSEDFARAERAGTTAVPQACFNGLGQRPQVILVVFESLSMYHSKLFSGMEGPGVPEGEGDAGSGWMPQFDAASQGGRRFANFYANGVTSEQGLISLLTGEPPIAKGLGRVSTEFEQFAKPVHSVPTLLRGADYRTEFLTTGDLGFLGKGAWLKGLGFDAVEGAESPAYTGMRRYQFGAAPDDALYGRALQSLELAKSQPLFLTLETVTTHGPFVDPESGERSQQRTFGYADRQLGSFIAQLRQRGFFRNGYLLVMGDHRAMQPMTSGERARYGDGAFARTPFTLLGPGVDGQWEQAAFSQSDLYPSLQHLVGSGRQCLGPDQGVFLPTVVQAPACIYSHRPYSLNNVYVQCGNQSHEIVLDGDATRFVGRQPGPAQVLDEVHRLRLSQGFF